MNFVFIAVLLSRAKLINSTILLREKKLQNIFSNNRNFLQ